MIDIAYLINSINRFQEQSSPWKHFLVDDFFDSEFYKFLEDPTNSMIRDHNKELYTVIYDIFDLPPVRNAFNKIVNTSGEPMFDVHVHYTGYKYHIHADMLEKSMTLIVYLGNCPANHGTHLHEYNGEKYIKTIPFKGNRALLFEGDGRNNHSYGPFEMDRRSFAFNYFRS